MNNRSIELDIQQDIDGYYISARVDFGPEWVQKYSVSEDGLIDAIQDAILAAQALRSNYLKSISNSQEGINART